MNYRELRRLAFANAAAMVDNADLDSLYGELEERDWDRAERARKDVAEFIRRYAGSPETVSEGLS